MELPKNILKILSDFVSTNFLESVQLNSFDYFCHHSIRSVLVGTSIEVDDKLITIKHAELGRPTYDIKMCLDYDYSYTSPLLATISIRSEHEPGRDIIVSLGDIPIMVGSEISEMSRFNREEKCYFIIKGSKKIITMEERTAYNTIFLLKNKKTFNFELYTEFKSITGNRSSMINIGVVNSGLNGKIMVYCPDIFQNELLPIQHFLSLFMQVSDIIEKHESRVFTAIDEKYHIKLNKIIQVNFNYTSASKFSDTEKRDIQVIISEKFLIHLRHNSIRNKGNFIFYMLSIMYKGLLGIIPIDDRDHYGNKRIYTVNEFFTKELAHIYTKNFKPKIIKSFTGFRSFDDESVKLKYEKCTDITTSFKKCLTVNHWFSKKETNHPVSQNYDPMNINDYYDYISKIHTPVKNENNKIMAARNYQLTQSEIICPLSTPDGKKIGIVKHLATHSIVSLQSTITLEKIVGILLDQYFDKYSNVPVLVNGDWIGCVYMKDKNAVIAKLFKLKTTHFMFDISIYYNQNNQSIFVLSDAGRIMFPIVIKDLTDVKETTFRGLLSKGYVMYVDKNEIEMYQLHEEDIITSILHNSRHKVPHNFFFMSSLGFIGTQIPMSNHNMSPRNIFQCAMAKQSMVGSVKSTHDTSSVRNILFYAQTPLVRTMYSNTQELYESPSGCNVIMAFMPFKGDNQEDSIILNKSSLDRGLFMATRHFTRSYTIEKGQLWTPPKKQYDDYMYENLDNGLIKPNTYVVKNQVLVALRDVFDTDEKTYAPFPAIYHAAEMPAKVISVEKFTTFTTDIIIKIVLNNVLIPVVGDKFSSRSGQKGVIGEVYNQEDLPFMSDGTTPDILVNPLAIKRMTISHMLEMAMGYDFANDSRKNNKLCEICVEYKRHMKNPCAVNCFLEQNVSSQLFCNSFYSELIPKHYKNWESKVLYSGETGMKFYSLIYVGVIFYQRLKHIAKDKIYVRTTGRIQYITRQPREGRSVEGGYRIGVQERDVILAHGCSYTLHERIFKNSDNFKMWICECGLSFHGVVNSEYEYNICNYCKSDKRYLVEIPYVTKVFIQMMAAFNVHIKLHPRKIKPLLNMPKLKALL
jgi:DNA-directed RNA polymerase beta subunit